LDPQSEVRRYCGSQSVGWLIRSRHGTPPLQVLGDNTLRHRRRCGRRCGAASAAHDITVISRSVYRPYCMTHRIAMMASALTNMRRRCCSGGVCARFPDYIPPHPISGMSFTGGLRRIWTKFGSKIVQNKGSKAAKWAQAEICAQK